MSSWGVEQEVGGAIPSGMRKLVQQLAVGTFGQPVERQGWAQEVAAEVLELGPGVEATATLEAEA
jgi:hypothetical protein